MKDTVSKTKVYRAWGKHLKLTLGLCPHAHTCSYPLAICHTQHGGGRGIPEAYVHPPDLVSSQKLTPFMRWERMDTARLPVWSKVWGLSHGSAFLGCVNRLLLPIPGWTAEGLVTINPSSQAAPSPAPSESWGIPPVPRYREDLLGSGVTRIWFLAHRFCLLFGGKVGWPLWASISSCWE